MEHIKDFKPVTVPLHKIIFVTTSDPDYEMDRTMLAEHHPDYGQYTLINGYHCSCYDFDETTWDATIYTKDELKAVAQGWLDKSYGSEALIAPLILHHLERQ